MILGLPPKRSNTVCSCGCFIGGVVPVWGKVYFYRSICRHYVLPVCAVMIMKSFPDGAEAFNSLAEPFRC